MPSDNIKLFTQKLTEYKQLIDDDISEYSQQTRKVTLANYGPHSQVVTDVFLEILGRSGKRIRGALVLLGYEMSGGSNKHMIIQAARAIEMLHAYILIIDDIQDRSNIRRGGPSAHKLLANYHKKRKLGGDSEHFGVSLALNAALGGAHAAQMILANLPTNEEDRIKVLSIVNRTMLITAQGQTGDIMNAAPPELTRRDIESVLERKTAAYSFLNPLHVGMVLDAAECDATDAITTYAMRVGKAFQITDDILGTFGSEFDNGKSPMDDLREGKRTLLTNYALEHITPQDKKFLLAMLGNSKLTGAEFKRCKQIIKDSGALDYAQKQVEQHVTTALKSLDKEKGRWNKEGVGFLQGLAEYLLTRHS